MKKILIASLVTFSVGVGMVSEVLAQANPNQLVAQRKAAMGLQHKYFNPSLAMVQGRAPYDAATLQRNAGYLAVLSQLPWDDFQPTTVGAANTRAKEDIYKDAAKFKAAGDALQVEVQKFVTATRGGDQAAVGAAVRGVGKACVSCHDAAVTFDFRYKLD